VNKKAFTLIELIAVIMIIAIIVGIALPRFTGVQEEALITKAKVELRTIRSGVESYYMHQTPNAYPPSSDTLISDYLINQTPQIVSEYLFDPLRSDQSEYNYILSDNGRYYVIFSAGPNAQTDIGAISDEGEIDNIVDDIYVTNGRGSDEQ